MMAAAAIAQLPNPGRAGDCLDQPFFWRYGKEMASASSYTSLAIGTPAPSFSLPDVTTGRVCKLADFAAARGLLVVFLCRHCPYVVHVRDVLNSLASEFHGKGVTTVGISANDPVSYPDDAPARLAEMVARHNLCFPVLFDETQEVARAYKAACTPDFFLFDGGQKLYYRGRMDDSTPGNARPCTGAELRAAMESLLSGKPSGSRQLPSVGCSIKWRS